MVLRSCDTRNPVVARRAFQELRIADAPQPRIGGRCEVDSRLSLANAFDDSGSEICVRLEANAQARILSLAFTQLRLGVLDLLP